MSFEKGTGVGSCIVSMLTSIRQEHENSHHHHHKERTTKDFAKENFRRLREMQRDRQRTETKGPMKALWQANKYRDIPSRLSEYITSSETVERPSTALSTQTAKPRLLTARRSCSLERSFKYEEEPRSERPPKDEKANDVKDSLGSKTPHSRNHYGEANVPKLFLTDRKQTQEHINRTNEKLPLLHASSTSRLTDKTVTSSSSNLQIPPNHHIGKVPKYLLRRQKQWQQELEMKKKETPDPTIPPGHQLLSEENRLETLKLLEEKQRNLLKELATLPISNDTLRVRRLRTELEKKLLVNEEAIQIFSHSKVYIKNDD